MFFFFMDKIIDVNRIKDITKRIVKYSLKNGQAWKEEEKDFVNEIVDASFDMFSKRKLENQSFTVCNEPFLRKIKIDPDADGIDEKYIPKVTEFFKLNTEAYHELVAQTFISKTSKEYKTDNQLFYISVKSKYSSKEEDLFLLISVAIIWCFLMKQQISFWKITLPIIMEN